MIKLLARFAVEIAVKRIESISSYAGGEEVVLIEGKEFHVQFDAQKKPQKCFYLADRGSKRFIDIKNAMEDTSSRTKHTANTVSK